MYGMTSVDVSPVAATALASLSAVKELLGVTDGTQDAALTALLAVASAQIEGYCGRIFAARTVTETLVCDDTLDVLVLAHAPVSALASVSVAGSAQQVADMLLMRASGIVRRADGAAIAPPGALVSVVYSAGHATMPADVAHACALLVQHLRAAANRDSTIKRESAPDVGEVEYFATGSGGISLPGEIAALLAPHVRRY